MTRRELFGLAIAGPFAARQLTAADPGKPLFFSPDEFALLDTLTELIIPADSHSPGARAARVAAYIDQTTAEAVNPEERRSWTNGLKNLNEESQRRFESKFVLARPADQIALLRTMDQKNDPFFGQLKQTTAFAYYSSEIGIHKEIEYKGNTILQEFAGIPL
jgi:Gluconate 2-dehydrogenase subunit 3